MDVDEIVGLADDGSRAMEQVFEPVATAKGLGIHRASAWCARTFARRVREFIHRDFVGTLGRHLEQTRHGFAGEGHAVPLST